MERIIKMGYKICAIVWTISIILSIFIPYIIAIKALLFFAYIALMIQFYKNITEESIKR